ncbi:ankyrin repeat-containing domain protein [Aspergillus filifer]
MDWQVDPDLPDNNGRTPFSWAAENGHVEVVKALGAIHTININAKNNHHRAPLVDPNARDICGQLPLIQAAKAGGLDVIVALLDDIRVDIRATNKMGRTALLWALWTRNGYKQIACFLLEKGANLDIKDSSGLTPLWWAVRNGHATIVRLLINTGRVEPNARGSMGGAAFMWATRRGDLAVAKMLFDTSKINLLARDDDGRSVLSWSSGRGHFHVLEALGLVTKQDWVDETGFETQPDPES